MHHCVGASKSTCPRSLRIHDNITCPGLQNPWEVEKKHGHASGIHVCMAFVRSTSTPVPPQLLDADPGTGADFPTLSPLLASFVVFKPPLSCWTPTLAPAPTARSPDPLCHPSAHPKAAGRRPWHRRRLSTYPIPFAILQPLLSCWTPTLAPALPPPPLPLCLTPCCLLAPS